MPPRRRRAGSRRGAIAPDLLVAIAAEVARLREMEDPVDRMVAVGDFFAELDFELEAVSDVRLDALAELRQDGWTYRRLVEQSNLSKTRVSQLSSALRERTLRRRLAAAAQPDGE